jgi:hypothetical protein
MKYLYIWVVLLLDLSCGFDLVNSFNRDVSTPNINPLYNPSSQSLRHNQQHFLTIGPEPVPVDTYWLAKTVRLFRGGRGLQAGEDWESMARLGHDKILDQLMTSPQFGDMILDFNLYFLGFKTDSIFSPNFPGSSLVPYSGYVFQKPQAVIAAREVLHNGDYLKLFDLNLTPYILPVKGKINKKNLPKDDQAGFPDAGNESKKLAYVMSIYSKYLGQVLEPWERFLKGEISKETVCSLTKTPNDRILDAISAANLPATIEEIYENTLFEVTVACTPFFNSVPSAVQLNNIRSLDSLTLSILEHFEEWSADQYSLTHLGDLKILSLPNLQAATTNSLTIDGFWEHFLNSSTNMNRRRAASILKTYFCDDLTPINIPTMFSGLDSHSENRHASDPGCRSCHYKLDPMAGFFREFGIFGYSFKNSNELLFDDMSRIIGLERQKYRDQWKSPEGHPRTWNIGYIRQPFRESINDYGESLDDLFKIIRKAPEVKSCLVRRLAEYMLGTEQVFDQSWLDQLTDRLAREENSSSALRQIMKSLALSQTYRQRDPDPSTCYDQVDPPQDNSVPCEVRAPLQKHCVSCHNNSSADHGLDLTQWIPLPPLPRDGGEESRQFGFVHLDSHGVQRSLAESFGRIKARLEGRNPDNPAPGQGSSPDLLMPPGGGRLSSPEKQRLFRWIDQSLQRASRP